LVVCFLFCLGFFFLPEARALETQFWISTIGKCPYFAKCPIS
jgi:hypothetical protein